MDPRNRKWLEDWKARRPSSGRLELMALGAEAFEIEREMAAAGYDVAHTMLLGRHVFTYTRKEASCRHGPTQTCPVCLPMPRD